MPSLPQELWLRIAKLLVGDLHSLALCSRELSGPAYEGLYELLDFPLPAQFNSSCVVWQTLGNRSSRFVCMLTLGKVHELDSGNSVPHSSYRFDLTRNWDAFKSSLSGFRNLTSLTFHGVNLREDVLNIIECLSQLHILHFNRVCIQGIVGPISFRSSSIQKLTVTTTCWHARNRIVMLVAGCSQCTDLTLSWDMSSSIYLALLSPTELLSYVQLTIDVSSMLWPADKLADVHRSTFANFVNKFTAIASLNILGYVPLFHPSDFAAETVCAKLVTFKGSIHFMGGVSPLCHLHDVTLTDGYLVDNVIFDRCPTFHWSTLRLQCYLLDEDALKLLLLHSAALTNLVLNIADRDVE
ncbi:hypothetical protein F5051DRAFT_446186 [Lentinula edodes]|nr:hypothetical protein F5051DRAFT_446186 [Lentinula edodes]